MAVYSIPGIIPLVFLHTTIKESYRQLIKVGKYEEAINAINFICRFNKIEELSNDEIQAVRTEPCNSLVYNLKQLPLLFRKDNAKTTFILMLISTISTVNAYSFVYLVPNFIDYSSS